MSIIDIIMAAAGNTTTGPWDLAGARYTGQPLPRVYGEDTAPAGMFFKPDGLKLYVSGYGYDKVYQFTLSTAWSVGTAVYDGVSFSVVAQATSPYQLAFSSDGTKMFILDAGSDTVFQYTLSTAWDISTASYASKSKTVTAEATAPQGMTFSAAGTSMYIGNYSLSTGVVYQYTLSTAWDVSTATYSLKSFSTGKTSVRGIYLASSDTELFILSTPSAETVYSYTLSTAGDITTASSTGQSVVVTAFDGSTYGVWVSSAGDKLYVTTANVQDFVWQLDMSTNYNLSTATFAYQLPNVFYLGYQLQYPSGAYMTSDGLNMYITRDLGTGYQVSQFSLGTAWDIKSTTYSGKFYSATAQDSSIEGISLSSDKTKMFLFGNTNNRIFMYTLSTPGDVATATYSGVSFSVAAQSTAMTGMCFSSDGLHFYMTNSGTDLVYQYDLATAWDLSTATYAAKSFSVASQSSNSFAVYVSPDGAYLYVLNGSTPANVYEYAMTTAFDVSTAYYTGRAFNFGAQETSGDTLFFKPDGLAMYIAGSDTRSVFQYALGP